VNEFNWKIKEFETSICYLSSDVKYIEGYLNTKQSNQLICQDHYLFSCTADGLLFFRPKLKKEL
jgi:hypothetical protein